MLATLLAGGLAVGTLTVVATALPGPAIQRAAAVAGSALVIFAMLLLAGKLLLVRPAPVRALWPGAVVGAAAVTVVLTVGAPLLARLVAKAGPVYGSFATVAGMFALLYLVGQALMYAAEVAAVRYARLWPRALDLTRPTAADARALTLLAREQERIPAARVTFHLAARAAPPAPDESPPPAIAAGNAPPRPRPAGVTADRGGRAPGPARTGEVPAVLRPEIMPRHRETGRDNEQTRPVLTAAATLARTGGTCEDRRSPRNDRGRRPAAPTRSAMSRTAPGRGSGSMISLDSWWWPVRPARVPKAAAAGLVAALGAALFGGSAIVLKTGMPGWDASLFRLLNQVPAAAASVLTPLSRLFLPAGIIAVVALAAVYVVARNRSVLPVAAGAAAAGLAWVLVHVAKAIADRPRPYEVVAGAVLRQEPAHGTSFPSSHTAVTLAVAIALVPFLARPLAPVGIGYAVLVGWSRVYLGVHYPLDVLAGAGIGMAAGGVILLALGTLLRRAGRAANLQDAAAGRGPPGSAPGPTAGRQHPKRPEPG